MTTQTIEIKNIKVDPKKNTRAYLGDFDADEESPTTHNLFALARSLETRGQDTPIKVRENLELVAGYRRHAAVSWLFGKGRAVKGLFAGEIRADIVTLNDLDALVLNLRENTARENLCPADIAHGVGELVRRGLTQKSIAEELGLSVGYVQRLAAVHRSLSALIYEGSVTIFEHWRAMPGRLPFETICDFASIQCEPAIKELKYRELLKPGKVETGSRSRNGKFDETRAAERFGAMLGRLEKAGLVSVSGDMRDLLTVGRDIDVSDLSAEMAETVISRAQRGYERNRA